jgi:hypothetical protein
MRVKKLTDGSYLPVRLPNSIKRAEMYFVFDHFKQTVVESKTLYEPCVDGLTDEPWQGAKPAGHRV